MLASLVRLAVLQGRSADRTRQVYVNVLKRSSDTFIRLTDHYTLARPQ